MQNLGLSAILQLSSAFYVKNLSNACISFSHSFNSRWLGAYCFFKCVPTKSLHGSAAADGFVVQTGDPQGPAEGFIDPSTEKI